jgi:Cof subfamily protein (haloacid dehalogenase superfamily)
MLAYRLLALDLDGTVVRRDGEISQATLRAVARARARGLTVCVATGRTYGAADVFARRLGADGPIIACDGALVREARGGAVRFRWPMDPAAARTVCRLAEELGGGWLAYGDEGRLVSPSWRRRRRTAAWRLLQTALHPRRLLRWLEVDRAQPAREASEPGDGPLYKLVLWAPDPAQGATLRRAVAAGGMRVTSGDDRHLEVVALEASKGRALAAVADSLGVPADRVIAFGDGRNDVEMLRYAGYGVAMATAPPDVRAAARAVAEPVESEGVARTLQALLETGLRRSEGATSWPRRW